MHTGYKLYRKKKDERRDDLVTGSVINFHRYFSIIKIPEKFLFVPFFFFIKLRVLVLTVFIES